MKNITVRDKVTEKEYAYTQLTSVEDINSYINGDIEFSETKGVINDIITQRGVTHRKSDATDNLLDMYKHLNSYIEPPYRFTSNRDDILEIKREGMIELFNKYGEIWVNRVGGYTIALKDYEIIN